VAAWIADCVVGFVTCGIVPRTGGAEGAEQPLALVVGDVAEVPDDGAHERVVLANEGGVGERGDDLQGAGPDAGEERLERVLAVLGDGDVVAAPQEEEAEESVRILVEALEAEAEAGGGGGHVAGAELAADLGADHLAGGDAEVAVDGIEVDAHLAPETGVDLDPLQALFVVGHMIYVAERNARAELAVHAVEEVQGEARAPAGLVVVGGLEPGGGLHA